MNTKCLLDENLLRMGVVVILRSLTWVCFLVNIACAGQTTKLFYGSCSKQSLSQEIWDVMASQEPDYFFHLGDSVYGSNGGFEKLKAALDTLKTNTAFQNFRAQTKYYAIWDDHDYGINDGGRNHPYYEKAKKAFLDAHAVAIDSPQRRSERGIYFSKIFEEMGQKLHVIVLDTRSFRDDWKTADESFPAHFRYQPDFDPKKTILGEVQWQWLEKDLEKEVDLRLVVSSYQIIAENHGFERWGNFPLERERLYRLLSSGPRTILLSGDRHLGGLYQTEYQGQTLIEMTSSALNQRIPDRFHVVRDSTSISDHFYEINYGSIEIDWQRRQVSLALVDIFNQKQREIKLEY